MSKRKIGFKNDNLIKISIWAVISLIFMAFLFHLYIHDLMPSVNEDKCLEEHFLQNRNDYPLIHKCYKGKLIDILHSKGIKASLEFANSTINTKTNYLLGHIILHELGHKAYHKTSDLNKTLQFLPSCFYTTECLWRFDGFKHGVFQSYFKDKLKEKPMVDIIREACEPYFDSSMLNAPLNSSDRFLSAHCFHASGHAIMAATNNDVSKSLFYCDELPDFKMKDICYYGVFMEYTFLYIYNQKEPSIPSNISMVELCSTLDGRQKFLCSHFVAWQYFFTGKNYNYSLSRCLVLDKNYTVPCILIGARLILPAVFKNNFDKIIEACKDFGPELVNACISGAAFGIRQGVAGYNFEDYPFCSLPKIPNQSDCKKYSFYHAIP